MKNIKKNVKERLVRIIFWNFREQMHTSFETVFEWPNEIPTSPKKKKTSLQNFKEIKMQIQTRIKNYSLEEMCTTVSNISKVRFQMAYKKTYITLYNIYQFKKVSWWKIRCVQIALSTFYQIYSSKWAKDFYRAKWRTGFGKKCCIILTAKGQTFAHSGKLQLPIANLPLA